MRSSNPYQSRQYLAFVTNWRDDPVLPEMHEPIKEQIILTRDRLPHEGRLLSPEDLAREYETFQARFGPDHLRALSGPDLLSVFATRGSKDSLPDQLEEQGRDRQMFGELRPSSQYCLGLWFDPGVESWSRFVTGREYVRGKSPFVRISMDQAIDLAARWRSQLLRAADLISRLPESADDGIHADLSGALRVQAPDLIRWPWFHKYICFCYPDRIDQFHDPRRQRLVLTQCLKEPPHLEGRRSSVYAAGGWFVRMARELRMSMNHLCLTLDALLDSE